MNDAIKFFNTKNDSETAMFLSGIQKINHWDPGVLT